MRVVLVSRDQDLSRKNWRRKELADVAGDVEVCPGTCSQDKRRSWRKGGPLDWNRGLPIPCLWRVSISACLNLLCLCLILASGRRSFLWSGTAAYSSSLPPPMERGFLFPGNVYPSQRRSHWFSLATRPPRGPITEARDIGYYGWPVWILEPPLWLGGNNQRRRI